MYLLSIDTTTRWGSVAVLRDGDVVAELRVQQDTGHAETVLVTVDQLLRSARLRPSAIDAYVAAIGPGSFTGVRVGVSTVQGLSLGSGRPCLGLSTLLGLAGKLQGTAPTLVPLIDAQRHEHVFAAVYAADLGLRLEPAAMTVGEVLGRLSGPAAFLGDGALKHRSQIEAGCPQALFPERTFFTAATIGRLALPMLVAGAGIAAAELRPLYLRAPDIRSVPTPPA